MKLGDFLVESRCRAGHMSSASYRGYPREHVELVARLLTSECTWQIHEDGSTCGLSVAHEVHELGASDAHEEAQRAIWRAATAPAMPAAEAPWPGPRSSSPPPPPTRRSTAPYPPPMPPPSGKIVAGEEDDDEG